MTATENPIDNDDRLKGLLSTIKDVKSRKAYNTWRKSFLKIYTKYLDSNGILNGKDANYRLLKQLERLANRIELIQPTLQEQSIDTANGRRLLTNLTNEIVATERKVQELMPKTNADEERFGFDKFELAAVLLEDGFHGYDSMIQMRQELESIIAHLVHENTNEIAIIHQYSDSVESFIKVMEDLKLFKIMNHCVDVVYQGKERPAPTPPPPPSDDDEEEAQQQELPEDSSICSDPDGDNLDVYGVPAAVGNKSACRKTKPTSNSSSDEPEQNTTTTKKKKKKKNKSTEKSLKSPTPKKKKKAKKKGDSDNYATDDTEEEAMFEEDRVASSSSSSSPSKPKQQSKSKQSQRQQPPRQSNENDDDSSDDDDDENEKSDQEDDDDDENGVAEFLMYFDPKTNTMGRIPRQIAATKSTLVVDKSTEEYKNIVESQDEKQELIFKLKKLERQKPQEENWLDKIKREKAAAAAAKAKTATSGNPKKKFHKSTARISRRNSNDVGNNSKRTVGLGTSTFGSGGKYKSPLGVDKKHANVETSSFRNPLEDGSSSSTRGKSLSTKPKNYQEKYKQIADKPDSSGWSKPASSRGLLQ